MGWRPEDLADLTPELRALLRSWDPLDVVDVSRDEYDYLTGLILARLGRGDDDRASFCQFMANEGRAVGASLEQGDAFGAAVFAWFSAKRPPSELEKPSPPAQLRKGRRYRSSHWRS